MIKKLVILAVITLSTNLHAQDNRWALEGNLSPFFLGTLNSEGDYDVEGDGISGGYDIGISMKYNISENWQIDGGVRYSKQVNNGELMYFVPDGSDYRSKLSYIKIPLIVNYGWDWSYMKDTRLSFGLGGQLLILDDSFLRIEDRLQIITIENGLRTLYVKDEDVVQSVIKDDFFSKSRLGLIGQFGLEKQFSDSFSYSIKLRTEYDLNLIDNNNGFNYDLSYFRIGLKFGIQYNFQPKSASYIEGIM
ncbi:outer membrane beta-barrel protein [Mesonia sp.]|uniref:outer membrane beta-barrel protein n=1 Tax=Mesonia sp. TaxID=1960830 RepID=UPI000C916C0D|nr:outer membrane beta-barrel protein [Mesonia sp.]MAN25815.1 hypothetical protein [Mesonia sp.]|tara:strand:- start:3986 stop:4729 length:744 start_codon:yes stop_codon:yes gene_type:complete